MIFRAMPGPAVFIFQWEHMGILAQEIIMEPFMLTFGNMFLALTPGRKKQIIPEVLQLALPPLSIII